MLRRNGSVVSVAFAAWVVVVGCADDRAGPGGPDTTGGTAQSYDISTLASGIEFFPASAIIGPQPLQAYLITDGTALYWTEGTETPIRKVATTGGATTALAIRVEVPVAAQVRGSDLYWIESREGFAPSGCAGAGVYAVLWRTPLSGGSRSALAVGDRCAGGATDFVIDDANLYWVTSTTSPNAHVIMKVPIGGGPSTPLVTAPDFREITGLAGDATYVYWEEDADTNRVLRIPKTGGAVDTIATIADGFRSFRGGLVVDGTDVFFGDTDFFDEHRVMKVSVSGGAVTVLADITGIDQNAVNTPRRFRVESPTVYWIDAQAIHGVPMDSGAITTPESGLASPVDFVVTATDLVWIESVCCAHGQTGRLKKAPVAGGAVTTIFDSLAAPTALAVDGSTVYWTEGGPIAHTEGFGRIARAPISGGTVTTVVAGVSGAFTPLAVDAANVYIGDAFTVKKVSKSGGTLERLAIGNFYIQAIATDGAYVYWTEGGGTAVRRVSVNGGPVTTLAAGLSGPAGPLAVDATQVYWMHHFSSISKVAVSGGSVVPLATGLPFLTDLTVDGVNVYYSENDSARIRRMSVNGGASTTLAFETPLASPHRLALDSQNVYWVNQAHVAGVPKSGGTARTIAEIPDAVYFFPNAITAAHRTVYWTDVVAGTIRKATPH